MNGDAVCTPARRDASVLDLNRFALLFYCGAICLGFRATARVAPTGGL